MSERRSCVSCGREVREGIDHAQDHDEDCALLAEWRDHASGDEYDRGRASLLTEVCAFVLGCSGMSLREISDAIERKFSGDYSPRKVKKGKKQ